MKKEEYILQREQCFCSQDYIAYLYGLSDDPFTARCTYHFQHHCLYAEDYTQDDLYQPIRALTPTLPTLNVSS